MAALEMEMPRSYFSARRSYSRILASSDQRLVRQDFGANHVVNLISGSNIPAVCAYRKGAADPQLTGSSGHEYSDI